MNYIDLSFTFSDEIDFKYAGIDKIIREKSESLNLKVFFYKNKNK